MDMVFDSGKADIVGESLVSAAVVDMVFDSGKDDIVGESVVSAIVVESMFGSLGHIVESTLDTVERVIMDLVVMLLTVLPEMIHMTLKC